MKRIVKMILCIFLFLVVMGIGGKILAECLMDTDNRYIVALIGYFAFLYLLSRTKYFQNHILTNVRGGGIVRTNKKSPQAFACR